MFRGIPSIQIPGLSTSCTVKSKHYFSASLFMSFCRPLLEFWTLVRARWGSRGYRCRRNRCSIPQSRPRSPPPHTRRSGWGHRRTVRPPPFQNSPPSARQSGGERKRVITWACGLGAWAIGREILHHVITRGCSGYDWQTDITQRNNISQREVEK